MAGQIKNLYLVHHSHTDIGYTDLQERIIANQVNFIKKAVKLGQDPQNQAFRWNCETLYCVEKFFEEATEEEKQIFIQMVKEKRIGISANYLNFTDLCDTEIYSDRLSKWVKIFPIKTAMFADINGVSMGYRDAMIENGVEFLYTNIHTHHGMYPLRENQIAFFWQNKQGKKLLVWNGEHYNLGNFMGMKTNRVPGLPILEYGQMDIPDEVTAHIHSQWTKYLLSCEENGYPYDFTVSSVSGVFTDNAPPEPSILKMVNILNEKWGNEVQFHMVSLQELYDIIGPRLQSSPVYTGDFTDWWANGAGSTPYAVKHYREAQHKYHLCTRLDPKAEEKYPVPAKEAQDNLFLYAEHTWGHSSTITNPYDTMVLNLDMRKNSYASKAHEAAALMFTRIGQEKGDTGLYYNANGQIRVCNPTDREDVLPVSFYVEYPAFLAGEITDEQGKIYPCQVSPHPRGRMITFLDRLKPHEEKLYHFRRVPAPADEINTRRCYVGAEQIRDIVNDYETVTYKLPYGYENDFFKLTYAPYKGITSFVNKKTGEEMLGEGIAPFFTPIYQVTRLHPMRDADPVYKERALLGRNIRGKSAETYVGELTDVETVETGNIFTQLRFKFRLEGTVHADVVVKFYQTLPRIDYHLELGKTISSDVESVFLPLSLKMADRGLYLRKGKEAFRPGVDQLPGSCMEFYMSEHGAADINEKGGILLSFPDTPLVYMGDMAHHPIRLCENKEEDNRRPIYSWIMNNNWETNFKMDLSGFCEYNYSLWLTEETDPEKAMDELKEKTFDPIVFILP